MKATFNKHRPPRAAVFLLFLGLTGAATAISACSSSSSRPEATGGSTTSSTQAATGGGAGGAGTTFVEKVLTLELALSTVAVPTDGGMGEAGEPTSALTITARDGVTPVVTDLWLYTLDTAGKMTPLTGFTSTAARKTPRLMLPATIGGKPSGLTPADNGDLNGVMTNASRGTLDQGAFVSTVNGTVVVTLPAVATTPILVIAGVEDQRYAGAAVINADGTPGTVPTGVGAPETHARRTFAVDVAPILKTNCTACHVPTGVDDAPLYLVTGTRDDLVNDNFALKEETEDCQKANPEGGQALAACIQAINKAQFLVEPGAPAVSDLLQRARPDEDGGTSALGLLWYGGKGQRYNTTYGDRRMPSTTESTSTTDWTNAPTFFDVNPAEFQILFDWVAQGAPP
jgi:hypothetical protein